MDIKKGQEWIDNKTGKSLMILRKKGDKWECQLKESMVVHKMNEYIIRKHYSLKPKNHKPHEKSLRQLIGGRL